MLSVGGNCIAGTVILTLVLALWCAATGPVVATEEGQLGDVGLVARDAILLCQELGQVGINLVPDRDCSRENILVRATAHVASNALLDPLALLGVHYPTVQGLSLVEVAVDNSGQVGDLVALVLRQLVKLVVTFGELGRVDGRQVVRPAAVVVEGHAAISLEVVGVLDERLVDRQLLVVNTNSVPVGVGVREESGLKDRVGGWLKSRNEMSWVVGNLLDLGEVVLDVAVELDLAKRLQRVLGSGPRLGQVKDVNVLLQSLLWRHNLVVNGPAWELSPLDSVVEVELVNIWRCSVGLSVILVVLHTLVGQDVDLAVVPAFSIGKLEGVARVTLHVTPGLRPATVTKQVQHLVDRLGVLTDVVPECCRVICVSRVGCGVALLCVDELGD